MAKALHKIHSVHELGTKEVTQLLEADLERGLSTAEAKRRKDLFGPNRIVGKRETPVWKRFLLQFQQPLVFLLVIASCIALLFGKWIDASVIFAVVLINAIVGMIQEVKAQKALDALMHLAQASTTVLRDGHKARIDSEELVPGDIVVVSSGDRIPADLRLFHARGLQIDESALTGESAAVYKHTSTVDFDTVLADRKNLAFSSTLVATGHGLGVVWATGNQTEIGKIAKLLLKRSELETPLTKKLAYFSQRLLWAIFFLCSVTFGIGLMRGEMLIDMFMASVAIAVGIIPEGLPTAVTIVLAIGVARMAERKAIVCRLPAVETLGSTTVICSDKTGTLTKNEMTVCKIYSGFKVFTVTGSGYEPKGQFEQEGRSIDIDDHPALFECLLAGLLCNDSQIVQENGCYKAIGDPTEVAMLVAAEKAYLNYAEMHKISPRMDMLAFESEQMFRATLHKSGQHSKVYQVGAVEKLLQHCDTEIDDEGHIVAINKERILEIQEMLAKDGLRVLACARRIVDKSHTELRHELATTGLCFLGMQAMDDPVRPEAVLAVSQCQQAGITVKMITGDHVLTAQKIAEQLGLTGGKTEGALTTLSGRDLEKISDEELIDTADNTVVFARTSAEQKLRIVEALQTKGHIIAMTGDGVNDAPALKRADIGIAMGLSGTDVAKGAADLILTDDNFKTIQAAVEEGRGIFDNLTKFLVWTLPTNMGQALILLVAIALGVSLPILPLQLLWVNMTTALFLGMMLAFEPKEEDVMKRAPRSPQRPILTFALFMRTGLVSCIMLIGAFWLFFWELNIENQSTDTARTTVVNVAVFVEMAYLFNCRSLKRPFITSGVWSNPWTIAGACCMILMQLAFTYNPVMQKLFYTADLSRGSWGRIFIVGVCTFIIVEFEKWCRFRKTDATAE